jgi:hypothetical protein
LFDLKIKDQYERYLKVRKKYKKLTKSEISNNLKEIMLNSKLEYEIKTYDDFILFLEEKNQDAFEKVMFDERNEESSWVTKFLEDIDSVGINNIPTEDIMNYIKGFYRRSVALNKIKDEEQSKIYSKYISRLILKLLYHRFHDFVNDDCLNDTFIQNCNKLSKLTMEEIGVDKKFIIRDCPDQYKTSIKIFSTLAFIESPNDLLDIIFHASKMMVDESLVYCHSNNAKFTFGADEYFPLLIYVIIKSEIYYLNSILKFILKYANQTISQKVYYFSQFECMLFFNF